MQNKWSIELSRRLRGTNAGRGLVRPGDNPKVVRLKNARKELNRLRQQPANSRSETEVRTALHEFDEAMRDLGLSLGCSAPLNP